MSVSRHTKFAAHAPTPFAHLATWGLVSRAAAGPAQAAAATHINAHAHTNCYIYIYVYTRSEERHLPRSFMLQQQQQQRCLLFLFLTNCRSCVFLAFALDRWHANAAFAKCKMQNAKLIAKANAVDPFGSAACRSRSISFCRPLQSCDAFEPCPSRLPPAQFRCHLQPSSAPLW